jgi:hypothetical protein
MRLARLSNQAGKDLFCLEGRINGETHRSYTIQIIMIDFDDKVHLLYKDKAIPVTGRGGP